MPLPHPTWPGRWLIAVTTMPSGSAAAPTTHCCCWTSHCKATEPPRPAVATAEPVSGRCPRAMWALPAADPPASLTNRPHRCGHTQRQQEVDQTIADQPDEDGRCGQRWSESPEHDCLEDAEATGNLGDQAGDLSQQEHREEHMKGHLVRQQNVKCRAGQDPIR